jgi:hypothetical protein
MVKKSKVRNKSLSAPARKPKKSVDERLDKHGWVRRKGRA